MHVSKNRVEGSLSETTLDNLLEPCRRHLFTGTIEIRSPAGTGLVQLHAGAVDETRFGELTGEPALVSMRKLSEGDYQVIQRVPDLTGELGSAAGLEGEVSDVPIAKIMRHCEQHALTCVLTVVNGFDRGEISYKAGDLAEVSLNGTRDDDAIVAIVGWKSARFRVVLPPLDLDIKGWPTVKGEPTAPFKLEKQPPPPKRAASVEPAPPAKAVVVDKVKEAPAPAKVAAPAVEKPAVVVAKVDKPAVVAKADKPAAEKPAAEKPAVEKPAVEKPAVEKPAVEKPAVVAKEAAEKPAAEKPAPAKVEAPAADKPAADKPAAKESSEKPTAKEPALQRPAAARSKPEKAAKNAPAKAPVAAAAQEPAVPAASGTPFRVADLLLILAIIAACGLVAWLLGRG